MMDGASPIVRTALPREVRIATPADERAVFDLFMMAADENAMAPVAADKVIAAIRLATERRGAVIGVTEGDHELAGAVMLGMAPFWYSNDWHVEEFLNFVRPEYRKGARSDARHLIQFAKWWSDTIGIPLLMGVLTHTRTEGKVRLYRRMLPYKGALFLYEGASANG